jgi:hypothetical protein
VVMCIYVVTTHMTCWLRGKVDQCALQDEQRFELDPLDSPDASASTAGGLEGRGRTASTPAEVRFRSAELTPMTQTGPTYQTVLEAIIDKQGRA